MFSLTCAETLNFRRVEVRNPRKRKGTLFSRASMVPLLTSRTVSDVASSFRCHVITIPSAIFRRTQDAGRTPNQWVVAGFDRAIVIIIRTIGLSIPHATNWAELINKRDWNCQCVQLVSWTATSWRRLTSSYNVQHNHPSFPAENANYSATTQKYSFKCMGLYSLILYFCFLYNWSI